MAGGARAAAAAGIGGYWWQADVDRAVGAWSYDDVDVFAGG